MVHWIDIEKTHKFPTDGEQKLVTYIPYARYKWKDDKDGRYCISMAHYADGHWVTGGYYVENVVAWAEVEPYIPNETDDDNDNDKYKLYYIQFDAYK